MDVNAQEPHTSPLTIRLAIFLFVWVFFLGWNLWEYFANANRYFSGAINADFWLFPMLLNFWGLIAGIVFAGVVKNPFHWLNGKRLVIGCIAFAMMAGRLASGPLAGLLPLSPVPMFLLMPIGLTIVGAFVIITTFFTFSLTFITLTAIPVLLFIELEAIDKIFAIYRYQSTGLAGYLGRAILWLRNERLPPAPPDDSKGARFATMQEIARLHKPDAPEAMAAGHIGSPVFIKTDKHVLIMASTRSGKGVTMIIPHLLRYQGSAFVLDPKGENAKATGRRRAQLNNLVHYLDPFGISGKPQSRFNPLSRFTPENMEAESKALAAALFVIGDRERDHWTASGQQLLAAVILFVYVSTDIPKGSKDLPTVRKILLGGLKQALQEMVEIDAADGLLRDLAMSFLETPERELGSIISTAQRQTEILDNPFMIACLSATGTGPEVDFKAWHKGTMTVYLCLSAPKFPVFNRWLRLVLTSALDEMTDSLNPPPLSVCFMLDELATLGHLAAVENAVGLAAGYGIQLVTVFQDVAQMRDLYKGRWASFIGNAGLRALFNLDDFETAEYWSKFVGGRLVETRSRQQDLYGYSSSENVGEAMRPLLPTDKIMMDFSSGKMLVLAQGVHPFITDRIAYFQDQSLNGLWDDPRGTGQLPSPALTVPPPLPTPPAPPPPPPPTQSAGTARKPDTPSPNMQALAEELLRSVDESNDPAEHRQNPIDLTSRLGQTSTTPLVDVTYGNGRGLTPPPWPAPSQEPSAEVMKQREELARMMGTTKGTPPSSHNKGYPTRTDDGRDR